MGILWRFRRKFLVYKLGLSVIIVYLVKVIFRLLMKNEEVNIHCLYKEPIDVVYTWVNGSDQKFKFDLEKYLKSRKLSLKDAHSYVQRFDDKYELKFSLRSLEKHAPWINHVYIVTNGQIPYWLNLDYQKVTIITHEEIFKNLDNLPTFSSPAIESNIHRIPGLSKKFIYFNDDVFLGAPTYLEDFYAPNKGFLIYLAYSLPMCSENCSWTYVKDGQCDEACLNEACQNDGGDCDDENKNSREITEINKNEARKLSLEENYQKINNHLLKKLNGSYSSHNRRSILSINFKPNNTIKNTISSDLSYTNTNHSINPRNYLFEMMKKYQKQNITKLVHEHNKRVLLNNKLFRNKRKKLRSKIFISKMANVNNINAYSESLQFTHRIFNLKYGYKIRKVPSHAPILIDKNIVEEVQREFYSEFARTEKNKVRSVDDVQYSFAYYYYIVDSMKSNGIEDIFDMFDTDESGTWSDREIRTLLTKLYQLPLSYAIADHFEGILLNCSNNVKVQEVGTSPYERYVDSRLPTISKELVLKCPTLDQMLLGKFGTTNKYRYKIVGNVESHVTFVMLHSNLSDVVSYLDEIRNNPKKFICLNDDMDYTKTDESELVKSILYDFYMSFFPKPSAFELPEEFRNKFGYVKDLNEWKEHRFNINICVYLVILVLFYLTCLNTCKKYVCQVLNKLFYY